MLIDFHIGIDDTDSKFGGCTTYTAALIFEKLIESRIAPTDLPWLVRLNPNIPWKTRGNGALAIHLRIDEGSVEDAKEIVIETVGNTSDASIPATDPAAVFLQGPISTELDAFTTKALHDVIRVKEAQRLADRAGAETYTFNGHRGIIGALAAIGYGLNRDHTFEIIAYRTGLNRGTPRRVDMESVKRMDRHRDNRTFNNLDPETGRVLVCPHGPDPVLLGIRGEDPLRLFKAFQEVKIQESIERVMLFRTNHGTDAHLTNKKNIGRVLLHQSVVVTGRVQSCPTVIIGGHVIFRLQDKTGSIDCAAYEPTGSLRNIVRELIPGDRVRVSGGVRAGPSTGLTLNLEKLEILRLVEDVRVVRPRCSRCNSSCESMGRGQGFRCRRCSLRLPRDSATTEPMNRSLREGQHIPPPRAHRHLTKPEFRHGTHQIGPLARRKDAGTTKAIFPESGDLSYFSDLLKRIQPLHSLYPIA